MAHEDPHGFDEELYELRFMVERLRKSKEAVKSYWEEKFNEMVE